MQMSFRRGGLLLVAALTLSACGIQSSSTTAHSHAVSPQAQQRLTHLQPHAQPHAQSFSIDNQFVKNAEASALIQEPNWIPGNDCTHWISYFLNAQYNMPTSMMNSVTDNLINNLIADGDAQVITGDGQYDAGGFIDATASSTHTLIQGLDQQRLENGGSEEFLIAFKWNPPDSSYQADHLAVFVGSEKTVAHGTGKWNRTPQPWYWYNNLGTLAVIALTNTTANTTAAPTWNEAGHVLIVVSTTEILDANQHTITARCNGPSDSSGATVPAQWDVVALDNSPAYQVNGLSYFLVAYPDPCEPGYDFSSNGDIASGAGAVGYLPMGAMTEADAAVPNPQFGGAAWRDCWGPDQCGDATYPNTSDTLTSKDAPYLFAWWTGSYWDCHWWHVYDTSGNEAAIYGRDWAAIYQ
jgi:hypothetical protein